MKRILTVASLAVLMLAGGLLVTPNNNGVMAHESEQDHSHNEEPDTDEQAVMYSYVAQLGDSYSLMARKAIQTYGLKNDVKLSEAGILYAETNLTQQSGSPQLEVGQRVEISEAVVSEWAGLAQKLTDQQLASWDYYAQFANFNTDSVGQEN